MHARRSSTGVQLPLPTTLVQTTPTSPSFPITASAIHQHNAQFPPLGLSHVAAYTAGGSITSPVRSTHAGGIQPSASFFRPVRPNQPQSPTMWNPPRYPEDDDDHNKKTVILSPPPPLTSSLSHSSSLSAHQHHHSNHSSEHVKAHEDQGDASEAKGVVSKLSREHLIPFRAHKDPPQATSKRVSSDGPGVVILTTPPPNNSIPTSKRHSASYRPRLTFDSIRRSIDSATGSTNAAMKRFSFGKPTGVVLEGDEGMVEERRRSNDIPLTPRKKTTADGLYRTASLSSIRSAASSRRRRSASLSSSHTEPTSFDPTAPPLAPGQHPLMKTPLTHPLDPSLLPEHRLTKLQKRDPYGIDNSRTKDANEGSHHAGLPPPAGEKKRRTTKSFLTFLYPSAVDSPKKPKKPRRQPKEGSLVRRYYLHPSRNGFFLQGRIITGGDEPYAFIFTLVIVCSIASLWFAFVGKWWWQEAGLEVVDGGTEVVNSAARSAGKAVVILCSYAAGLVLSSMMVTAFSDPGILPRGLDPNPPYPTTSPSDGEVKAPLPRDLKVRNDVVRVKYCPTCRTYRPPRASHCKMCDNCVDACDHHCQWVNNCIGRRNYTSFLVLLITAVLTLILIIVTSALQLYFLTRWQHLSFAGALRRTPGSAVVFSLALIVIWPVAALLSYHLRLLFLNVTTIEQIRNTAHKSLVEGPAPPNPFSHGSWRKNFVAVLCRPRPPSWLNASGLATEDRREINPGMLLDNSVLRREASMARLGGARSGGGGGMDKWEDVLGTRRRDEDDEDEEDS